MWPFLEKREERKRGEDRGRRQEKRGQERAMGPPSPRTQNL